MRQTARRPTEEKKTPGSLPRNISHHKGRHLFPSKKGVRRSCINLRMGGGKASPPEAGYKPKKKDSVKSESG